jgi:hypothetical protein
MKYPTQLSTSVNASTGAHAVRIVSAKTTIFAWLPSTWPPAPHAVDKRFVITLKSIFDDSMLLEINNVIEDAQARNGGLQHRGHVVAIALMCALDAISAYGYRGVGAWKKGAHIEAFIGNHFSPEYHPYASEICRLYRNALIHGWNLFEATLHSGNERINRTNGILSFGLLEFFVSLQAATDDFLANLLGNPSLEKNTLARYRRLRASAK